MLPEPPEKGYLALADGTVMRADGTITTWEQVEQEMATIEGFTAVAGAWEEMLRRRHPGTAWEIVPEA